MNKEYEDICYDAGYHAGIEKMRDAAKKYGHISFCDEDMDEEADKLLKEAEE